MPRSLKLFLTVICIYVYIYQINLGRLIRNTECFVDPAARYNPSGEILKLVTIEEVIVLSLCKTVYVLISIKKSVLSKYPIIRYYPSIENAKLLIE